MVPPAPPPGTCPGYGMTDMAHQTLVGAASAALYRAAYVERCRRVRSIAPPGKYRLARALKPIDADALLDGAYAPVVL